jgi:hypothetical protein
MPINKFGISKSRGIPLAGTLPVVEATAIINKSPARAAKKPIIQTSTASGIPHRTGDNEGDLAKGDGI